MVFETLAVASLVTAGLSAFNRVSWLVKTHDTLVLNGAAEQGLADRKHVYVPVEGLFTLQELQRLNAADPQALDDGFKRLNLLSILGMHTKEK